MSLPHRPAPRRSALASQLLSALLALATLGTAQAQTVESATPAAPATPAAAPAAPATTAASTATTSTPRKPLAKPAIKPGAAKTAAAGSGVKAAGGAAAGRRLSVCLPGPVRARNYQNLFSGSMSRWALKELAGTPQDKVFYPFSGPDASTVLALFPKASYFLLVADQAADLSLMAPGKAPAGVEPVECAMMTFFARSGFNVTADLNGKHAAKPRLVALLQHSIELVGARIDQRLPLAMTADGRLEAGNAGGVARGVRFQLTAADNRKVTLDYLQLDLSNPTPDRAAAWRRVLGDAAAQATFLKAASHLPQTPAFSEVANLIDSRSALVVQDETGLGTERLTRRNLALYGRFVEPNRNWLGADYTRKMIDLFRSTPSRGTLPFYFGYEKKGGSMMVVSRKK